jgi:hypothetical protein
MWMQKSTDWIGGSYGSVATVIPYLQPIPSGLKNNKMAAMLIPNSMKDNEILLF